MNGSWLTNEEVMRGLSEGYVVIGDAPPPIRYETEDDEVLEQFGENIPCDNQPPDLQGITSYLRKVDNEVNANDIETPNDGIIIRKPSMLDPNIKEFVPKDSISSNSSNNLSESKASVEKKEVKASTDATFDKHKAINSVGVDIAEKLKIEISEASKSDSFEMKRNKNVAISSLMKLYATNKPNRSESLKLITPEFYENSSELLKNKENLKSHSAHNSPSKQCKSITPSCSIVHSEPAISEGNDTKLKLNSDDSVMKKSIDKVNQWLSGPEEKKTSPLCLGPIAFKRKELSTARLPPNLSVKQNISKANQPTQYKPSTYAEDLGKKYMAKNKVKESQRVNLWRDLHVILKEKDELLLRKSQASVDCDFEVVQS